MKLIFTYIIFFCFAKIYACSIIYDPPEKFDPSEFIFIGKVVDHVSSLGVEPRHKYNFVYNGFTVEVIDIIYLPDTTRRKFKIFPLSLGADCSLGACDKQYIQTYFPISSVLRIVAKKTDIQFADSVEFDVILEVSPLNQFHLTKNILDIPFLISTKTSVFNYYEISNDSLDKLSCWLSDSMGILDIEKKNEIFLSALYQKDFELRKDLYTLSICNDDKEKVKIIYRLKNFTYLGSKKLINITFEYIIDKTIRDRLLSALFMTSNEIPSLEWVIGR